MPTEEENSVLEKHQLCRALRAYSKDTTQYVLSGLQQDRISSTTTVTTTFSLGKVFGTGGNNSGMSIICRKLSEKARARRFQSKYTKILRKDLIILVCFVSLIKKLDCTQ